MQQMLNQQITATITIILIITTYSGSNAPTVMKAIAISTGTTRENPQHKSYALIKKDWLSIIVIVTVQVS